MEEAVGGAVAEDTIVAVLTVAVAAAVAALLRAGVGIIGATVTVPVEVARPWEAVRSWRTRVVR